MTRQGVSCQGSCFIITLLLLLTAGCLAPPTLTPTPTQVPIPTASLPSILASVAPVAQGKGISGAAVYNPAQTALHRLVLLTESGSPHEWNKDLPNDWLPASLDETELVVLVGDEQEIALASQDYIGGAPVTAYQFVIDIEIREARTGHVVMTDRIQGSKPGPFPPTLPFEVTRLDGEHVTPLELERSLSHRVICGLLDGHTGSVRSVAFSSDGRTLASGSEDETVRLWQIPSGDLLHTFESPDGWWAESVAFSPDGQILASGSGSIHLWQISDGTLLHTLYVPGVGLSTVAFLPDEQTLVSGYDSGIHLWQISDGALLRTLEVSGASLALSPDGQTLASEVLGGENIDLRQISDGVLLRTLQGEDGEWVHDIAFSPDGMTLASGTSKGIVRVWRLTDGRLMHLLHTLEDSEILAGNKGWVNSVAFSPDGQLIAAGGHFFGPTSVRPHGKLYVWQVSDGALLDILNVPTRPANSVAFSPDGQMLAWGEDGGTVHICPLR